MMESTGDKHIDDPIIQKIRDHFANTPTEQIIKAAKACGFKFVPLSKIHHYYFAHPKGWIEQKRKKPAD